MKTALQHPYSPALSSATAHTSIFTRFFNWCASQEKYRFGWLAAIIAGHGCLITPLTLMFVMLGGNQPIAWAFAIGAMGMSLISNLAALPTKFTIPIFFFSLLIDAVLIAAAIL